MHTATEIRNLRDWIMNALSKFAEDTIFRFG